MDRVTVVVTSYNRPDLLNDCLFSLAASTIRPPVHVVADRPEGSMLRYLGAINASGKDSIVKTEVDFDNKGLYHLWNLGVKAAQTDYVLITNDDIIFCYNTIERLLKVLDEDSDIWCVCPSQTTGLKVSNELAAYSDLSENQRTRKGFYGSCFMVRKKIVQQVGYFAEAYRLWGGDTEFFDIITLKGHPSVITGTAWVHHFKSITVDSLGLDRKRSVDRPLYAKRRRILENHYRKNS
jgi:GT2 family glycosyltransferase